MGAQSVYADGVNLVAKAKALFTLGLDRWLCRGRAAGQEVSSAKLLHDQDCRMCDDHAST
jgi:hypothetical protein